MTFLLFLKSVFIYTLFALIMYNLARKSKIPLKNKLPKQYIWCIIVFAMISGLRWNVGTDYLGYLQYFKNIRLGLEARADMETGYYLVTKAFAIVHAHYSLFFACWSALQVYFIIKSVADEHYQVVPFVLLMIPLSSNYVFLMNGIRQMVVACSFLWATKFILERDFKRYLLWVFACSFIHHSVWILLPFYFVGLQRKNWNNSWVHLSILIICAVLGSVPNWVSIMDGSAGILNMLGYDKYSSQMDVITSAEAMDTYAWGPRKISVLLLYSLLIMVGNEVKKFYKSPKLDLFYKFFLIGACSSFLFYNTDVFVRPTDYFVLFSLLILGYSLFYFIKTKQKTHFGVFVFVSFIFVLFSAYSESALPEDMRGSFLYQFCFSHWDIINNPIVRPN